MKKSLSLLFLASTLFAQYQSDLETPIKTSTKEMSSNSSTITNIDSYNTFSHSGIPIGILEYEDVNISANIGYNRMGLKDSKHPDSSWAINSISLPYIRVGVPKKIYFDAYYSINPIQSTQINNTTKNNFISTSMPLSRFGTQLVGQVPDGSFRIGVGGAGFAGTEKWTENRNKRSLLGAENVGLCIGFRLQELVNLSFSATTGGYVDSLFLESEVNVDKDYKDREIFAYWKIPQFDMAIDIGRDNLPYLTNFVFSFAKSTFTYSMKGLSGASDLYNNNLTEGYSKANQADAVVTDSIAFNWKNIWIVDAADAGTFKPALSIGMFHNWLEHQKPDEGDNIPFGPVLKGPQWDYEHQTGSFNFGLGLHYSMKKIVDAWFEYGLATLSMKVEGKNIKQYISDNNISIPKKHGYNRVGLGIKTNFDKWPVITLQDGYEISLLFSFMMRQENELYGYYKDWPLDYMYGLNDFSRPVEYDRYEPWVKMQNEVKTSNVTFGFGASFNDKMVETDIHLGILNQKHYYNNGSSLSLVRKSKGLEFGIDITYNQRKIIKKKTKNAVAPKI